MMGAITNSIWIQNDPKGNDSRIPERSRLLAQPFEGPGVVNVLQLRVEAWPLGEASIGHNGDHYFYDKGVLDQRNRRGLNW